MASSDSPLDPGDEEDQIAVDLGAVDKLVNVAGVHRLSRLQAARPDAVANCKITRSQSGLKFFASIPAKKRVAFKVTLGSF